MLNAVAPQPEPIAKKRKGPKGPNPLSVKKKAPNNRTREVKKTTVAAAARVEKVDCGKKRKRHEADRSNGTVSLATESRPKRRRRHKTIITHVEAV
jgi:U3 small nucleolar RNA-associated protein 23